MFFFQIGVKNEETQSIGNAMNQFDEYMIDRHIFLQQSRSSFMCKVRTISRSPDCILRAIYKSMNKISCIVKLIIIWLFRTKMSSLISSDHDAMFLFFKALNSTKLNGLPTWSSKINCQLIMFFFYHLH